MTTADEHGRFFASIATAAATAASVGDLLLLWVVSGGDRGWLAIGHYLGVLCIPLYAAGYWSVSRFLEVRSIFWIGAYAGAVGAAIHGVTALAILAAGAPGDPFDALAPALAYLIPLWVLVGLLAITGSVLQFRAVRASPRCPAWFAWTNPMTLMLLIAGLSLPFAAVARYVVPAAPNLAHVVYFAIVASVVAARARGALAGVVALLLVAGCGDDDGATGGSGSQAVSEDACQSSPLRGFGFDRYGGWKGIERAASGRFRVEQVKGVWWLITPEGHALFSNGPTGVDTGDVARGTGRSPYLDAVLARHGSLEAWADSTLRRFCDLGIRTLGGWMAAEDLDRFQGKVPYAVNVSFYTAMPAIRGGPPALVRRHDVFDARAEELADALASEGGLIARCAADPWCIGVYTENEVPYLPSLLNGGGHLDVYLSLPAGSPAKVELQEFFAARYASDVAGFNRTWETNLAAFDDLQQLTAIGSCPPVLGYEDDLCYFDEPRQRLDDRFAFEAHVAARSAALGAAVLRRANPEMLNLGPRIVVAPFSAAVLRALAGPADVMSMNNYDVRGYVDGLLTEEQAAKLVELGLLGFDPIERVGQVGEVTGKPVLITEWFYRRRRSGVSTFPPFLPEVADGPAQATAYGEYMEGLLGLPFVVGAHWFQWMDQPVGGRADGENQLIGIVDIDDNLNQPLADEVARINAEIIDRRLRAR